MTYLGLHLVKSLDIFFIGNINLFLGVSVSNLIDTYIAKPYDKKKQNYKTYYN